MLRLGLTGNVGAGKSTVVSLFASWGATIIDSDVLAREVVETGQPALARIQEVWGDAVLQESGRLDRAAMRRIVFADAEAREQLESILHPAIRDRSRELLLEAEARGDRIVVGVVPLLYEAGLEGEYDMVLLIDAPVELRVERLVSKRVRRRCRRKRSVPAPISSSITTLTSQRSSVALGRRGKRYKS